MSQAPHLRAIFEEIRIWGQYAQQVQAANKPQALNVEDARAQIIRNSLGKMLDVAPRWLGPVLPDLARVMSMAESNFISDAEMIRAVEALATKLPEFFSEMNHGVLEDLLTETANAALVNGAIAGHQSRNPETQALEAKGKPCGRGFIAPHKFCRKNGEGVKEPDGQKFSMAGVRRDLRVRGVLEAANRLDRLEATIIEARQKGSIDHEEYKDYLREIKGTWEEIGAAYLVETRNKNAVSGLKVLKTARVDESVLGDPNALGDGRGLTPTQKQARDKQVRETEVAMREGVQSVYNHMSTAVGQRIGPVKEVVMLKNDDPRLISSSGRRSLTNYQPKTGTIYLSSALQTREQIRAATAFATVEHAYVRGPQQIRDSLAEAYTKRTLKSGDLKTEAYGEGQPYFESRAFWSKYQGVAPVTRSVGGLESIDINRGGMHMATVSYATLLNGNREQLGRIMRDSDHRLTLFESLRTFGSVGRKGGKIKS